MPCLNSERVAKLKIYIHDKRNKGGKGSCVLVTQDTIVSCSSHCLSCLIKGADWELISFVREENLCIYTRVYWEQISDQFDKRCCSLLCFLFWFLLADCWLRRYLSWFNHICSYLFGWVSSFLFFFFIAIYRQRNTNYVIFEAEP